MSESQATVQTAGEDQTRAWAAGLGQVALPGLVIALEGELGAGKTRFSQGLAQGLGIPRQRVTSPTFSLVQEHAGRLPLFHFDAYRLRSVNELWELGWDEYLAAGGVCVVEWASRISEALPDDHLAIQLTTITPEQRLALINALGPHSRRVLQLWRESSAWPGGAVLEQ